MAGVCATPRVTGRIRLERAPGRVLEMVAMDPELRAFLTERFDAIDRRLDRIEDRLDRVEERLDRIEARLDHVEQRLDVVEARLDRMDRRFDAVDERLDGMDRRFDGVDERLDGMGQRFDGVDERLDGMDRRFDGVDRKIDDRFEAAKRYFGVLAERLGGDIRGLAEGHMMLDAKLERFRVEHDVAHREIVALIRTAYAALDRRVTRLETRGERGEAAEP